MRVRLKKTKVKN